MRCLQVLVCLLRRQLWTLWCTVLGEMRRNVVRWMHVLHLCQTLRSSPGMGPEPCLSERLLSILKYHVECWSLGFSFGLLSEACGLLVICKARWCTSR